MLNSVRSALDRRWCRILICLSPLIIMLLWMIGPGFFYCIVDDVTHMNIVRAFPLVSKTISVIWGAALTGLYGAFPGVEWYGVWVLASMHLALVALHACLAGMRKWPLHIFLWFAQIVGFGYFSFTTASFFSIFAGMMIFILHGGFRGRRGVGCMLLGAALIFNGSIIRMSSPLICCMGLAGALALMKLVRREQKFSVLLVLLAVCIASQGAVTAADRAAIAADPELDAYRSFAIARGAYMDNSSRDMQALIDAGMDESEAYIVSRIFYADNRVYSTEWFENARDILEAQTDGLAETAYRMAKEGYRLLRRLDMGLWMAVAALLGAVAAWALRKKAAPYLALTILMLGLEILYLIYIYKCIARVTVMMNILAILAMLIIFFSAPANDAPVRTSLRRIAAAVLACASAAAGVGCLADGAEMVANYFAVEENNALLNDYLQTHGETRYVFQGSAVHRTMDYTVSLGRSETYNPESLLGDWHVYSPYWKEQMRGAGFGDHLDRGMDILLEDGVELVVYNEDDRLARAFENFFRMHSGVEVECAVKPAPFNEMFTCYDFNVIGPAA